MAFEREKQAAVGGAELDLDDRDAPARDDQDRERQQRELAARRARAERAAALLDVPQPGRSTLAQPAAPVPAGPRDFRSRAMSDVIGAIGALARGERTGDPASAAALAPTMMRVAEARAITLHRHAVESGEVDAHDPAVDESLRQVGGGQALPAELKRQMEDEFGVSFDRVRVHTGGVAAEAARAIKAQAFTVGEDIFFAAGAFSDRAHKLVAHELAHVVQGWQGRTQTGGGRRVSNAGESLETEADAIADRIATRGPRAARPPAQVTRPTAGGAVATPAPKSRPIAAPAPSRAPAAGVHMLRTPDAGAQAAPSNGMGAAPAPGPAPESGIIVQRDEAAADAIRKTKQQSQGDAKAELATLKQNMKASTSSAAGQMTATLAKAAAQPVGAHAKGAHAAQASDHKKHQEQAHAAGAHAAAQPHKAEAAPHAHPEANPSAHDGNDGIKFKTISDWGKYMPKPLPGQDAREQARIQKLVEKKIEGERKQSAAQLGQLKNAQMKAAASVRGMKAGLQASIASAQTAAAGKVAAAEAAQAAAVQAQVAGVAASIRGQAAAMKAQVTSAHATTVAQINAGAQAATQKLTQAHAQAVTQMQTQEQQQHAAVTAAFAATKAQITALGATKASEATALPATISLPYSGDKLSAAKKAATKVGESYAEAMPEQATKASDQLASHEPDSQKSVTSIETQIQAKLDEAFTQSTQAIAQTQQEATQAADHAKTAALAQIDQTAASTVASLTSMGVQQVAGIHQQGAAAKAGIAKAGAAAIASVGSGVDKAAAGIQSGATGLAQGAKEIEAPSVEETKKQVASAGAELSKSVTSIGTGLQKSASDAAGGLSQQATGAATGMATAAAEAAKQATQMGAQATQSLQQMAQGAQKNLQQVGEGATKQFTKATESATTAFDACVKGQASAYTEQVTKLKSGLDGAVKNVSDSFNQAVPTAETKAILENAKKAADAVKPWWQRALAFVVSIVVAVVVVIAVTALIAVTGPVGMILVGALAGALSSVLSTMASNLILGKGVFDDITVQSVLIGAVGGAISGGLSGAVAEGALGGTMKATMAFEEAGIGGVGGFAVRTGVNTTFGMVSDAGAQMIVTGKYDFSMQNLVTTLVSSAAMSTKTFDTFSKTTGDAVRTHVGLDPLHPPTVPDPNAGGAGGGDPAGGAGTGGADPAPANPSSGAGPDPAGGAGGAHDNAPPANSNTPPPAHADPAPAPGQSTAPGSSTPPAHAPDPAPAPAPAGDHAPDPAGQPPASTHAPGTGDPAPAPRTGDPAPTQARDGTPPASTTDPHAGSTEPHGTDPAAQTKPGADPATPPAAGHDTTPATKPGTDPAAPPTAGHDATPAPKAAEPATPPTQAKGGEHEGAPPANDNKAPTEAKGGTEPKPEVDASSGGGGDGGGGAADTATDSALAKDGYENPTAAKRAAAESELRSGETPEEQNIRDTEANHRGVDQLKKLETSMSPEERTKLNRDLADKIASEPESTGNLEQEIKEVRQKEQTESAAAKKQGEGAPDKAHKGAVSHEDDVAALKQLVQEVLAKGPIRVEDARALADMARELGVPLEEIPRASSVADTLRAKGMTPEEIQMYEQTLGKDQQASKLGTDDADNHLDINRKPRPAASKEELELLLKANILLFDDFVSGGVASKVVPEGGLGDYMTGKNAYGDVGLRGDVGLARNTENMAAGDKVKNLGLDYKGSPYTDVDPATGLHSVKADVEKGLWQIDTRITQEMVDGAKVPVGPDLMATAQAKSDALYAARARGEDVEIPPLLEQSDGKLTHLTERTRSGIADPSAGFGYTASQGLRTADGKMYFSHNQEVTLGKSASIPAGAELSRIGPNGQREVLATWDGKKFVVNPNAPPDTAAFLNGKIAAMPAPAAVLPATPGAGAPATTAPPAKSGP